MWEKQIMPGYDRAQLDHVAARPTGKAYQGSVTVSASEWFGRNAMTYRLLCIVDGFEMLHARCGRNAEARARGS